MATVLQRPQVGSLPLKLLLYWELVESLGDEPLEVLGPVHGSSPTSQPPYGKEASSVGCCLAMGPKATGPIDHSLKL